jgi:hypothetical protein
VVGLGRGLIDRFFPRMKKDFSNILRSNKLEVKTVNKTLTTHRQRDWKESNNALKKKGKP